MVEQAERTDGLKPEYDFSFLEKEPHSSTDEMLVINGGLHLVNHCLDHRNDPGSDFFLQAEKLSSSYREMRIADLIIKELERVGGHSFKDLSQDFLDTGKVVVQTIFSKKFREALKRENHFPQNTQHNLQRLREKVSI